MQTNFGGVLRIAGAPVGVELGQYYLRSDVSAEPPADGDADVDELQSASADGSCMIVVATDAPLDARNLERLALRAFMRNSLRTVATSMSPFFSGMHNGCGETTRESWTTSTVKLLTYRLRLATSRRAIRPTAELHGALDDVAAVVNKYMGLLDAAEMGTFEVEELANSTAIFDRLGSV